MRGRFDEVIESDAIVVGSGIAGLTTALDLAPTRVVLLTKSAVGGGSTGYAQGGIAAAVGKDDGADRHAADTLAVGGGINDPEAVEVMTRSAAARVADLVGLGATFDEESEGSFDLGREGGHSRRRVLHAGGDGTGVELRRVLTTAVEAASHIEVLGDTFVADLVVEQGRVVGATARRDQQSLLVVAPAVVLATGGIGRLFSNTTNPAELTGDGLAMAGRAGAVFADLEFVQFHPTALATGRDPMSLLTEALRGEGAVLRDDLGERFLVGVHPDAELAPRDVVARAVWRHLASGRRVYLDGTESLGDGFPERFPTVFGLCRRDGIDPRREMIPVAPAAHFHMGGIATGVDGRSSVQGLWAVGEVARTGVHGANRLASNSLLEGSVFGYRAADDITRLRSARISAAEAMAAAIDPGPAPAPQPDLVEALRELMWDRVGLVRSREGLAGAIEEMGRLGDKLAARPSEAKNMLMVARLVARSALIRTESRGAHFRGDHPTSDKAWSQSIEVTV
jgi:L-aspartate oxidase